MIFDSGTTSQSIDVQIFNDSGLPVTGLVAAAFPTLKYSIAGPNADVTFPALSDLASITTGYVSGGVKERGEGVYRVDVPNAIFATAGQIKIRGEATGKHLIVDTIEVAPPVNTVRLNGTAQTARDIGENVLLSPGTGAGQVDLVNGLVNANITQILATALTETSMGNLAAAFKKLFDVAVPVLTAASANQGGDAYAQLTDVTYGLSALLTAIDAINVGDPQEVADTVWANATRTLTAGQLSDAQAATIPSAGTLATTTSPVGSVSGDVAGSVGSVVTAVTTSDQDIADAVWANATRTLTAGQLSDAQAATIPSAGTLATTTGPVGSVSGDVAGSVGSVVTAVSTSDQDIADAVWANATRTLTAGQLSDAQASTIPSAGTLATTTGPVGSVSGDVAGSVGSVVAAVTTSDSANIGQIKAKTDNLPANPAAIGSQMDLIDAPNATATAEIVSAIMNGGSFDGASLQGVLRLVAAAVIGKVAGLPGTSITQRAINDSKVRITATLDSDGNITNVTTDAT